MTVRLISDDARLVRRVRAGSVPEDTAYHEPVSLGAGVSKRQAEAPFTFPSAVNEEIDDPWTPASIAEDLGICAVVLLIVAASAAVAMWGIL